MDQLISEIQKKKNPSVAGLDPKISYVPGYIREKHKSDCGAILEFNRLLIDALFEVVPAVKPQSAYYEALGPDGAKVLFETIAYAREKGLYVLLDAKRNDIGTTSEAYAKAYLGADSAYRADALTVNGFLGTDCIKPFLGKGDLFVLVKTSNPSSGELQDLTLSNGRTVSMEMASLCETWGADLIGTSGYSSVGAVVGATYPQELSMLRKFAPHTFFLVPGYGAQGGSAENLRGAFDENGLGAIVNSSRAILCAYQKEGCPEREFACAARREAEKMRGELRNVIA